MSESEESISEPGSPTADSEMQVDVKSEVQSETVESTGPDDDECESMSFYDMNALDFLKLQDFSADVITVVVGSGGVSSSFKLSEKLLTSQIPYFRERFGPNISAKKKQITWLKAEPQVFAMVIHFLYFGGISSESFSDLKIKSTSTSRAYILDRCLDFLELAEKLGLIRDTDYDDGWSPAYVTAQYLRGVLQNDRWALQLGHVKRAVRFACTQPIRTLFAEAKVAEYLSKSTPPAEAPDMNELLEVDGFSKDLLIAVVKAYGTRYTSRRGKHVYFIDPLTDENFEIQGEA